jgi:hypothetical protein
MGAASVGVGLGGVGVAYAGSAKHTAPGTPGAPNCVGQTMAFLAQGNWNQPGPGIGNYASEAGITVKQVKADVEYWCTTGMVPSM